MKTEFTKCVGLFDVNGIDLAANYGHIIDEEVRHRFGGKVTAHVVTLGLQMPDFVTHGENKQSRKFTERLLEATEHLASLGAESALVCSNKLHVAADELETKVPLLHMTDAIVMAFRRERFRRVGIIGTRSPDEEKFLQRRLAKARVHDIQFPLVRDREHIAALLNNEFERGIVTEFARADVLRIVYSLRQAGARAVVSCAPELTAILEDAVPILPIVDAVEMHALLAVNWMTAGINLLGQGQSA